MKRQTIIAIPLIVVLAYTLTTVLFPKPWYKRLLNKIRRMLNSMVDSGASQEE